MTESRFGPLSLGLWLTVGAVCLLSLEATELRAQSSTEKETYSVHYHWWDPIQGLEVPPDRSYAQLTPEQKQVVRAHYPGMSGNDEPPYPIQGTKPIYEAIEELHEDHKAQGVVQLVVNVDSEGNATSVNVVKSTIPSFTRPIAYILMLQKYKPGVHGGIPTAMQYPFQMRFILLR
jgi:hypothetical protein